MNPSLKSEAVKNIFDSISPTYDRLNHILSLNIDKSWRKKTISMIGRNSDENFVALDLCAGTFDLSLELSKQFPNSKIFAIDFSQEMLNAGRHKIKEHIKSGKIMPVCGDCLLLPYDDNSIDIVVCAYGFRNFADLPKGLSEIHRVLKKGGQLVVLEFFKPSNKLSQVFHASYAKLVIPLLGKIVSGNDAAYKYLRDSIKGFINVNEFKVLLKEYNLTSIKTKDFLMSISTAVSASKT